VRLTERIHLVGSGEPDLATSDPIDSQVYLVDTGDGLLCIDAGAGRSVERIQAEVRAGGLVPDEIRWVLLTHGHADHAGGAAAWRRRLPDVRIGASISVAGWIETVDYIRTHKAETVKIESAITGFPESVMAKDYDLTVGMFTKGCQFDAESLATLKRSFSDLKLLDNPPDMSTLYTEKFLPK